jgi:hypothetical protein
VKRFAIVACVLLSGCASADLETFFPSSVSYVPIVFDVNPAKDDTGKTQYEKDAIKCHGVADGYKPGLSVGEISQQATLGATGNAAEAVINPLVPAAGAAGGIASAVISGVGLNGQASIKIFVRCLVELSHEDHAYKVADPNQ